MAQKTRSMDTDRLDRIVAEAQRSRAQRERSYREQALKLFPWVCGRCAREFDHHNVHELTVHHRDHNHDNNPADGSNWELLCIYCHDNEHARYVNLDPATGRDAPKSVLNNSSSTHQPFSGLGEMLKGKS